MKDDYLWDGSGEPDPEIERLENLLGGYRSERPAPKLPEMPVVPFRPRRTFTPFYGAAAAAVVLGLTLGLVWMALRQPAEIAKNVPAPGPTPGQKNTNTHNGNTPPPPPVTNENPNTNSTPHPAPHPPRRPSRQDDTPAVAVEYTEPAKPEPLVDLATAQHLEQAELLLRSFKNVRTEDEDGLAEVAIDTVQSRDLLYKNVILRRSAQSKKNLAVGQLLGDLEPILVDIATLGDRPSSDDVRSIQQRIQQRELVSDLELYSMNSPARGF